MAGITGIIASGTEDLRFISSMGELLGHRGTEGHGLFWFGTNGTETLYDGNPVSVPTPAQLALGHRRHHGQAQPLSDKTGRYWITADADMTPVALLSAFLSGGAAAIKGRFAFALFDTKTRTLTLARDKFGIAPLYFWSHRGRLAIASEIKALFALTEIRPKLARHAIDAVLANHPVASYFAHITEFPAGHIATIPIDGEHMPKPEPFWQPPTEYTSHDDIYAEYRRLLGEAMKHVPVGAGISLSGGLYSSAAAIALREAIGHETQLHSFTTLFDTPALDARVWVTAANSGAHTITNWLSPTSADFLTELDQLLWHHDVPISSAGNYAQWCLMRGAAEARIPVLVDGLGGRALTQPPAAEPSQWAQLRNHFNRSRRAELRALARLAPKRAPWEPMEEPALAAELRSSDRNASAFGISLNMPFLDDGLTEFVLGLSPNQRANITARSMAEVIPEPILKRAHTPSFAVPLDSWMQEAILPAFLRDIKHARVALTPTIHAGALRELVTYQMEHPNAAYRPLLFRLFTLNRWMQRFNVPAAN